MLDSGDTTFDRTNEGIYLSQSMNLAEITLLLRESVVLTNQCINKRDTETGDHAIKDDQPEESL